MRFVDHQFGAVLPCQFQQGVDGRDIALHAEDALSHDDARARPICVIVQRAFEKFQVAVRIDNFLQRALHDHADNSSARIIVTESVFGMEGDIALINALLELARKYGAELVIDEAHATGACGPQGRGIVADLGVEREMLAIVHTCGKALASAGAFVCGGSALRDYLMNRARTFIFSTAMPPYLAGQIHAALALAPAAESERAHLQDIASAFREGFAIVGLNFGSSTTNIVSLYLVIYEISLLTEHN